MSAKELDPVPRHSLGRIGVTFEIQLTDVDNQYNPIPLDITAEGSGYGELLLEFTKPDGSVVKRMRTAR